MNSEAIVYVRFCRGSNSAQEYANDQNTRELWVGPCFFRLVWGQIQLWNVGLRDFDIILPFTGPNATKHPDWQIDAFKIGDTYYSDVQLHTEAPDGVEVLTLNQYCQLEQ